MKPNETHGLTRIDENLLRLEDTEQVDVRVFANEQVQIEAAAVEELKGLLGVQATLERFYAADPEAFSQPPRLERISLTPDFHKARLWSYFHRTSRTDTLARIDRSGSLRAGSVQKFADYLGKPGQIQRDSQIGSIGGGNHFVEFQEVKQINDGTIAHAWGLREGMVTVMVHTGSVGIGHSAGSYYLEQVRQIYPQAVRHPDNNIFILPITEKYQASANIFWDAMHSAANFAYVNLSLGFLLHPENNLGDYFPF